ncbi:MAG TPA: hypothetical protein VK465_07540, partial [Fibrobacteria bacterium]|nr:hypothetical protein [Fibrobacteria bacterium]
MRYPTFFIGIAWLAVTAFLPVGAHCPGVIPETKFTYPSSGMAIQETCYPSYQTCLIDTFYTEKLMAKLVSEYKDTKYAIFGYIKQVENFQTYDTTYYMGEPYYVDTFATERISISIESELKDSLPVQTLTFVDRWLAVRFNPFATTYTTMLDTPFIAFFNQYDSIKQLGIGPMDGCFFEPTVYSIFEGRIHKKGLPGERMPGISVTLEDFFKGVGRDPVDAPPVSILKP